jgi:hypothetical protein
MMRMAMGRKPQHLEKLESHDRTARAANSLTNQLQTKDHACAKPRGRKVNLLRARAPIKQGG